MTFHCQVGTLYLLVFQFPKVCTRLILMVSLRSISFLPHTTRNIDLLVKMSTLSLSLSLNTPNISAFSSRAPSAQSMATAARPQTFSRMTSYSHDLTTEPVVIVGSGLAALSAASELVSHNIPVHILERQSHLGGNSIKASSGINGVPTRFQPTGRSGDKTDSISAFYDDTTKSVGLELLHKSFFEQRDDLIATLTTSSASAITWLTDDIGVDLSHVARLGGHSFARTHRGAGSTPPGRAIVTALIKQIQDSKLATIETNANVTSVIRRGTDGMVVGVEVERKHEPSDPSAPASRCKGLLSGPVIFAAGGFAGDHQGLLQLHRPDLATLPTTNDAMPGSARLLRQIGAQLRDMDLVQIHPTGFVDPSARYHSTKFLAAEALRGEGGILISKAGTRFVDELQTRKVVTERVQELEDVEPGSEASEAVPLHQWDVKIVLDQGTYEFIKSHVDFYIWKGLMKKTTVGELEAELQQQRGNINSNVKTGSSASWTPLLNTLKNYASIAAQQTPDPLGRTDFGNWTLSNPDASSVLYVGTVTPVVHYTMGGVAFNSDAEVLDEAQRPIQGLWAAGEVTGGLHGGNRLGGSSLLECVVFGRTAGTSVRRWISRRNWVLAGEEDTKRLGHYESPA